MRSARSDCRRRCAKRMCSSNRSNRISRQSASCRRSQRPPIRLTKWQPVAARGPSEAIRAWLLTRTQYKDERINNLAVNRVLSVGRYFEIDRKSTRLNSSHVEISYAVFCLKKKKKKK